MLKYFLGPGLVAYSTVLVYSLQAEPCSYRAELPTKHHTKHRRSFHEDQVCNPAITESYYSFDTFEDWQAKWWRRSMDLTWLDRFLSYMNEPEPDPFLKWQAHMNFETIFIMEIRDAPIYGGLSPCNVTNLNLARVNVGLPPVSFSNDMVLFPPDLSAEMTLWEEVTERRRLETERKAQLREWEKLEMNRKMKKVYWTGAVILWVLAYVGFEVFCPSYIGT
ncbi:hypothetical protein N0V90_002893 [Kalmusia sp. IMI 367209]|nr:hypothetical protein N0V90_002893 [Kalmusia sp. IMI 367209]